MTTIEARHRAAADAAIGDTPVDHLISAEEDAKLIERVALAIATAEEVSRTRLERLPDRFSAFAFVNAGLPLKYASRALMVSRRILEDNEND